MADQIISQKTCTTCNVPQPPDNFHRNKTKSDGHQSECKGCRRIRNASYYARNRAKYLERFREYRATNPEYFRAYNRQYYEEHGDRRRAQSSDYYHAHAEKTLAKQKARRDGNLAEFREIEKRRYWENPERSRANRRSHYKKNAKRHNEKTRAYQIAHPEQVKEWKRNWLLRHPDKRRVAIRNNKAMRRKGKGRFSLNQLLAKYEFHGWRCYLCRRPITFETSHPDHRKPVARGGSNWIANIAPACIKCNLRKNRRTETEYRALLAIN